MTYFLHSTGVIRNPANNSNTLNSSRISSEYQPIVRSHIPPGAYPVLPTSTGNFYILLYSEVSFDIIDATFCFCISETVIII